MVKHKTAQELMAERNPLTRMPVTPVDIYSQSPAPAAEPQKKPKPTPSIPETKSAQAQLPTIPPQKKTDDNIRPYSTYLRQSQVKGIKLRAIERDLDDKDIAQEAFDEYFKNHPL